MQFKIFSALLLLSGSSLFASAVPTEPKEAPRNSAKQPQETWQAPSAQATETQKPESFDDAPVKLEYKKTIVDMIGENEFGKGYTLESSAKLRAKKKAEEKRETQERLSKLSSLYEKAEASE